MNLPVTVPDWMPWWVPILLLVPALMWGLAFLLLPFSAIGVKGRLETIEARLDEIQGEIRSLSHRLPEPMRQSSYDDVYAPPGMVSQRPPEQQIVSRPPIPPAPQELEEDDYRPPRAPSRRPDPRYAAPRQNDGLTDAPRERAEPRLNWPR